MEIIRLPKNATLARLTLSKISKDRVRGIFESRGQHSGFAQDAEYDSQVNAEKEAFALAGRYNAAFLIIDDRT
jgi:predicted transcriptional regulator